MCWIGLLLGIASSLPDSATAESDNLEPATSWSHHLQGSVVLAGSGQQGRPQSFVTEPLGKPIDQRSLRAWGEARASLSRRWEQSGQWRFEAFASPLVGIEHIDSSPSADRPLWQLREAWTRLEWAPLQRWTLGFGRRSLEPGASLASHPSRVLPFAPPTDPQDFEIRNPVFSEMTSTWVPGWRTAIQYFPNCQRSDHDQILASPQDQLWRVEQSLRLSHEHDLRFVGGIGRFWSMGADWEWSHATWFLSAEAAWRDDLGFGRPLQPSPGIWTWTPPDHRVGLAWTATIQRDLTAPLLGQVRLSVEWAGSTAGWSTRQSRSLARELAWLADLPRADPATASARQILARFASQNAWIDGYAHRVLIRLGSVQSLRWGGGINVLAMGPFDGALAQFEAHATMGGQLAFDGTLTTLMTARSLSLLSTSPLKLQAKICTRWSW